MSTRKIILLGIALAILVGGSLTLTFAAPNDTYVPLAPLPHAAPESGTNFSTYLSGFFKLAIGTASALAVIMIIIGGFQYASTDALSGKEEGRERINNALIGLLLALVSWLILYTVNPDLVKLRFLSGGGASVTKTK